VRCSHQCAGEIVLTLARGHDMAHCPRCQRVVTLRERGAPGAEGVRCIVVLIVE
jgi:hypothetical protein